jgi:predicted DNA-binding transcriptional regulator YafY
MKHSKTFLAMAALLALCGQPGGAVARDMDRAAATSKAAELSAADRQSIQRVILLQIRAFERMDGAVAFSYSTPETRRYFGTPQAFMDMVRKGYSALFRNVSREFLEAAIIDGAVVQPLRIVTVEGETLVAIYTLERQPDREWRISGCELAPSKVQSI